MTGGGRAVRSDDVRVSGLQLLNHLASAKLADELMTPSTKAVLFALLSLRYGKTGAIQGSREQVAERAWVDVRTVQRTMKALREAGVVEVASVNNGRDANDGVTANTYVIVLPPLTIATASRRRAHPGQPVSPREDNLSPVGETPCPPVEVDRETPCPPRGDSLSSQGRHGATPRGDTVPPTPSRERERARKSKEPRGAREDARTEPPGFALELETLSGKPKARKAKAPKSDVAAALARSSWRAEIEHLHAHYAAVRKSYLPKSFHPTLTLRGVKDADALLSQGAEVTALECALEALWISPWHNGENDRRKAFQEFFHAFTDANFNALADLGRKHRAKAALFAATAEGDALARDGGAKAFPEREAPSGASPVSSARPGAAPEPDFDVLAQPDAEELAYRERMQREFYDHEEEIAS